MALLTRSDLHAEIDVRFPDNKTELITPPLVRAFLHNLVDSALLAASDKLSLSKALSLTQAQALLTSTPPSVDGGQYYAITGKWNKALGSATVYVHGLSNVAYEPQGVLLADGKYVLVKVDVALGTAVPAQLDLSGYAPLDSPEFAGTPTAPTPLPIDSSERLATTAFVQNVQALSYTNAAPLVCEWADGTLNFTFTTLHEAVEWTNGGGPGSTTYANRPQLVVDFVTLAAGTILDLQGHPVNVNQWPIRLGPGAEIRHNRLLYNGRIAPFTPGPDPALNFCTIFGGTLACRINFQSSTAATVILDAVTVADFGQSQFAGITGGTATTGEPNAKVLLRKGSHFTAGYQPHLATTVTVEAESGATTDAQAVAAVGAALVAGNPQHTSLVAKIVNGQIVLEVKAANVSDIVFDTVALGAGNLVAGHFNMTSSLTGYYELKSAQNISSIQIFRIDANANDFNGSPATWPATGVYLQASLSGYTLTITPLNVNAPTSLLLRLL